VQGLFKAPIRTATSLGGQLEVLGARLAGDPRRSRVQQGKFQVSIGRPSPLARCAGGAWVVGRGPGRDGFSGFCGLRPIGWIAAGALPAAARPPAGPISRESLYRPSMRMSGPIRRGRRRCRAPGREDYSVGECRIILGFRLYVPAGRILRQLAASEVSQSRKGLSKMLCATRMADRKGSRLLGRRRQIGGLATACSR